MCHTLAEIHSSEEAPKNPNALNNIIIWLRLVRGVWFKIYSLSDTCLPMIVVGNQVRYSSLSVHLSARKPKANE